MWAQAAKQVRAGASASSITLCSRRGFSLFSWVLYFSSSSCFLNPVTGMAKTQPIALFIFFPLEEGICVFSPLEIPIPWNRNAARIFTLMVQRMPLQKALLLFLSLIPLPSIAFCLCFPLLLESFITKQRVGAGAGKKHLKRADCKAEVGWLGSSFSRA